MTMEDFAQLCYFIIKYFDIYEVDYTVGLGGMKPQIWFVPDDLNKPVVEAAESTLDKYESDSNTIFGNLKKCGIKKTIVTSIPNLCPHLSQFDNNFFLILWWYIANSQPLQWSW
jgi:hypothetical protein